MRVTRFRLNPIALSLLCAFAQDALADVDTLELRMGKSFMAMAEPQQEAPAFLTSDLLEGKMENLIEATGNAVLRRREQSIRADRLLYFQETQEVEAQGSVVLKQGSNTMSGPHLKLNLDTNNGVMEHPVFHFAENDGRGSADILHFRDQQYFTLDNASYTTCSADEEDWLLKMSSLEIDRNRQIGTARQARVEFFGVPILYSPWMDFPLNDQRKSGFLAPVLGSTSKGGSELTLPYYFNVAPNLDVTFAPRVMMKRGVLLNNEFRYLEPSYAGELHLDVLPNDRMANRTRRHMSVMHTQAIASALTGQINLNSVSDDDYFRDLGDAVNTTSQVNLLQEVVLIYGEEWWGATARLQRYQTLQDPAAPITPPYKRLPQLTFNAQRQYAGANLSFAGEFVDFTHPTLVNAQRLVFNPAISYPLVSAPAFYVTPKLGLHGAYYAMGANNAATLQDTSRILPIFSVDSGIALERDLNLLGVDYLSTLEPRIFYVYVPFREQDALPNFDSAQADFSFFQMFTENRFFGNDRIGDANHITLAATTRLFDQDNGMERLRLTIGERFSFETPRVNLVAPALSTNKSDVLLAASGRVTDSWTLESEIQYDPNQAHTQRYNFAARYYPEPGKALNLGYRFQRNTLRQTDISAQWPLSSNWHAVGRWNYSFQDSRLLEGIAGLEYNRDCWMLRLVAQRFTTATQQTNTGFFVQLELNDLVKVGSDPLNLLRQSVPGYTKLNDRTVKMNLQDLP